MMAWTLSHSVKAALAGTAFLRATQCSIAVWQDGTCSRWCVMAICAGEDL